MSKFFRKLYETGQIDEWVDVLDWLFDDNRFSQKNNWDSKKSEQLTKSMGNKNNLSKSKNTIKEININLESFPQPGNSYSPIIIIENKKARISEKIIRHIRNAIAHGNYCIIEYSDNLFIELLDFEPDKKTKILIQTAYIYIPLAFILDFYKSFVSIQSGTTGGKKKYKKKKI